MEMWRVAKKQVIIVGFLEFTGTDFDRLQYGVKEGDKFLPHWFNMYSRSGMEKFIAYNMPNSEVEIMEDYEGTGHPIIIIKKAQS